MNMRIDTVGNAKVNWKYFLWTRNRQSTSTTKYALNYNVSGK